MKPLVIGLSGYAGAGKDTAADGLVTSLSQLGYKVMRAGFADPIREMLRAIIPADYMTVRELKEKPIPGLGVSYRKLAQTLGTEWGREQIGPDFWLALLRKRFEESDCTALVITDVRFPNEVQFVSLDMDGYLVRITRPHLSRVLSHVSEDLVEKMIVDWDLCNSGSKADLRDRVHDLAITMAADRQAAVGH